MDTDARRADGFSADHARLERNASQEQRERTERKLPPLFSPVRSVFCVACSLAAVAVSGSISAAADGLLERRWVYLSTNLLVKENLEPARAILKRAKAAGYNGVVLADFKLNILDRVPDFYFGHARQFAKIAAELGLEVVPKVASIGYSDGLLAHDPNLAEGIPVRETPFVVQGSVARLDSNLKNALRGGTFEEHTSNRVTGWDLQDAPGEASFVDASEKHSGKSSLRWDNPGKNAGSTGGNPRDIVAWLKTARTTTGVAGAMYTTWRNDFSQLESFAQTAWGGK
jgi:hypothetical protein